MQRCLHPRVWRLTAAAVLGVGAVIASASPASAHTVGGVNATNYRTRVLSVHPRVDGVRIRVIENGNRLQLTNDTARDVTVLGYDGEPYLRIGPRGVFENARSPATYLNRTLRNPSPPPRRADPSATPEWRPLDGGHTARWHDHRAHWMANDDPPSVTRDPHHPHVVQQFRIVVRAHGDDIRVRGDVWWIPGPSPWPWLGIAAATAIVVIVGARTRHAASVIAAGLVIALGAAVAHAAGSWTPATTSFANHVADALPTFGAVGLGVVALVVLVRRGVRAAAPVLVFAGLFVAIAIGLADFSALHRSQLPTDLSPNLDRLAIALALGGGIGTAVGAAFHVAERPVGQTRGRAVVRNENQSQPMIGG